MRHIVLVFPWRVVGGRREYLLIRRVPAEGGFWQPVTGGVEPDEAPGVTAAREVAEETGLAGRLQLTGLSGSFHWAGIQWREDVFTWEAADQPVSLGPEHDAYRWCGLAEAWWCLFWPQNRHHLAAVDRLLKDQDRGA